MSKNNNKFQRMLENTGMIQFFKNIINSSEWYSLEKCGDEYVLYYESTLDDGENYQGYQTLDKWIYLFFLKGRSLRGGLATPMARFYGWKAVNKMEY